MKGSSNSRRQFFKNAGIGSLAAGMVGCSSRRNVRAQKKRILVGRFSDETNTFINDTRTLEDVKKSAGYGNDFLHTSGMVHGTYGTSLDGFADIMEMYDIELIGSISAGGNHRIMTEEVFDFVTGYMLDTLDKHPRLV